MTNPDSKAVSPEQRHLMIAEAAYYHAERRGFLERDPIADWVEAEKEVDAMLTHTPIPTKEKTAKEIFEDHLETQLKEWDKQISGWKRKVKKVDEDARRNIDAQLEKHHAQRVIAQKKLKELRQSGGQGWEEIKGGAENVWKEIHQTIHRIAEHFR
ncbi:DUF2934 domain-containing protein [Acidithiobacillus thiooxidans]|uniref:DUF2934 domain-containing protein n=1 Tax=Acidithiobacillus thiooxidans TaxID=930 RepID=UPI0028585885|nr:DUF2934 domain-containing protein [Acidithiobacillus thiooxidans]MDR7926867.1 DUF2934 domain-containing protein [Acidithiobacillus thiooxidans]